MRSTSLASKTRMPSDCSRAVLCAELDTAPVMRSFIVASASMNLLTVEPVPTPTTVPGSTNSSAAWPTRVFSSSWVMRSGLECFARMGRIMSFVPYALTRPFLFGLDPETAHDLTLAAIARLQNTPAQAPVAAAAHRRPGRRGGPALPEPRRPGRRAGQERPLHRRPGRDGLRLHRGRHRHAAGPARQPQAADVPPAGGTGADQPAGLQQRRARGLRRQRAARAGRSARRAASSA